MVALPAESPITAEDVKVILLRYAEQFGERCEVASAVFSLSNAEPELLVVFPGRAAPPRLIPFASPAPVTSAVGQVDTAS